jgi:hypothetical protein
MTSVVSFLHDLTIFGRKQSIEQLTCFLNFSLHFLPIPETFRNSIMEVLSRLLSLLSQSKRQTRQVDMDDIYPIHFIDNAAIIRTSIISYTFRYTGVLDCMQLHDSLVKLLTIGDWKKLRGRLRENVRQ